MKPCLTCGHASGYHGNNVKRMLESEYMNPCKIEVCKCKDFEYKIREKLR